VRRVRKYYYNTKTHRFEKLVVSWRTRLLRIIGFISSSLVTALIIVAIAFRFLDSPKEKQMRREMQQLSEQYTLLRKKVGELEKNMGELEDRDNHVYRTIFESAPLPDSIRRGKRYDIAEDPRLSYLSSTELAAQLRRDVEALQHRIQTQQQSYDTLQQLVKAKEKMLASIPAIQPISNKNLKHVASGFGYRIDPIYKTPKMHTGLDFAAPVGTPVYATADGVVRATTYERDGYGRHVIIHHGYGYQTLYAHLVRIKARPGEKVKRGQVIGWVGSTGKSTAPHCHYEVIRNNQKVDPVHFFFNDLSAADYERMIRMAASTNQSFD
jgi:murein DD-endopeptidase MepM/ murein hydrolase activator NlpD